MIKRKMKNKTKKDHVRTSWAPVGGTSSMPGGHVLHTSRSVVPCHPVCHLLPTFVDRGFPSTPPGCPPPRIPLVAFPSTPPVAPPPPIPLGTTRGGYPALSTQLCLVLEPPHHEPCGCFKDLPVQNPRVFCSSEPHRGLNPKHQGGVFR